MLPEEKLALDCPCCGDTIYRNLSWFKKTYSTCPSCGEGLAASQFDQVIRDVEAAFEEADDELVGAPSCSRGCCDRG